MTRTHSSPAEASPECFLVTADGLVQSVLRRYSAVARQQSAREEQEQSPVNSAVA